MNSKTLFLLGCIPARALLAWYTKKYPSTKNLGYVLLVIAVGFMYLYFNNLRLNAKEASGGVTWWAPYRIIHGLLYLAAAIYMFKDPKHAWIPLASDVILGFVLWFLVN
jgi:hypothetical protein